MATRKDNVLWLNKNLIKSAVNSIIPDSNKDIDCVVLRKKMYEKYCKKCCYFENIYTGCKLSIDTTNFCEKPKARRIWKMYHKYYRLKNLCEKYLYGWYWDSNKDDLLYEATQKYLEIREVTENQRVTLIFRNIMTSSIANRILNSEHGESIFKTLKTLDLWRKKLEAVYL